MKDDPLVLMMALDQLPFLEVDHYVDLLVLDHLVLYGLSRKVLDQSLICLVQVHGHLVLLLKTGR